MAGMDKICSLHDAIARDVQNGMSVAMGCGLESLIPFAASYEIIGHKKTDLPSDLTADTASLYLCMESRHSCRRHRS
jgi:acyl CoA:acetate/3-ketoacid CoA transferase alpha subunit